MKSRGVLLTVTFCLLISLFLNGSVLCPDRDFSQNENRSLQTFPKFTASRALSGEFQSELTDYMSDQVFLRDRLISLKSKIQKLCGKRDIGGVYLLSDGSYIEKITEDDVDKALFHKNVGVVEEFFKKYESLFQKNQRQVMLVPTAGAIYGDRLPNGAAVFDQVTLIETAQNELSKDTLFVPLTKAFKAGKSRRLYYKTDHHWTEDGAAVAYMQYAKVCGFSANIQKTPETVSENFRGTLYSKVLDSAAPYDTIKLYRYKSDEDIKLKIDGNSESCGIYSMEKLKEKDQYAVFLGGNYPKATLSGGKGDGHLLIIKDSYANGFVPFLMQHYEKITLIDPRYFTGSTEAVIKSEGIDEVLFLFNMENFVAEKNLSVVLS